MSVSRLLPGGGANDFNLNIGGSFTSVSFDKEYSSGSYSIVSGNNDTTIDIYAYNSDGSLAGYTNTKSFTATKGFNKMVILGGQTGDVLGFTYKTTYTTVDDSDEVTAGPVATSLTPSAVPKIDDTFTITGRNFASNCTVTFSSTTGVYTSTAAKSIVRSSATSLIVTRPDNLPVGNSPYTITVQNPGVNNPTATNAHILANSITAGVAPVWVTGATISYVTGTSTSITLSATDADAGSDVDYSIVSGTLPTGLSLDGETGVISGTPTTSNVTVTFRATDQGGNFVDKAILFNAAPVWVTGATLTKYANGFAYSVQLSATDDNTAVSYSLVSGSLPPGLSLSSGGLISGTPSGAAGTYSPTIRATDTYGATADRAFTLTSATATIVSYTSVGTTTFTLPAGATGAVEYLCVAGGGGGGDSNLAGGGGGAGGLIEGIYTNLTPGNYTVTVGGGGNGGSGNGSGNSGGNSVFHTATAYGGGYGAGYNTTGGNGGSGGGGSAPNITGGGSATIGIVPAGHSGFGNNGYSGLNGGSYGSGGAGGGAGGSSSAFGGGNSANSGGAGRNNSISGSSVTYATGGGGASNFYGGANATIIGGGGGGTGDATAGSGANGIVVIRYLS
jgi:hypothetical protein